jgi:hypothetical protein
MNTQYIHFVLHYNEISVSELKIMFFLDNKEKDV